MTLLKIRDIRKSFRGLRAVDGVDIDVHEGELLGLIGPNGSGKTTLLNMLSGHLAADGGTVTLGGKNVLGFNPTKLTRLGILRMFQMTRVFNRMSAFDNLTVCGLAMGLSESSSYERAEQLLEELKLSHVMYLDAGHLSGGQRKLLEFGTCFMVPPRIALLDESFAAVHPVMKETMSEFIRNRNQSGQTFILVSHDMPIVIDLCPRSVCMSAGKVLAQGPTHDILKSASVIEAYLGEDADQEVAHV